MLYTTPTMEDLTRQFTTVMYIWVKNNLQCR